MTLGRPGGILRRRFRPTSNTRSILANSAQARKRARQAESHRLRNVAHRSTVRTYIKKVDAAIESGDQTAAASALANAQPVIDKMVGKGILHRNKAARHKSRLAAKIRSMAQA